MRFIDLHLQIDRHASNSLRADQLFHISPSIFDYRRSPPLIFLIQFKFFATVNSGQGIIEAPKIEEGANQSIPGTDMHELRDQVKQTQKERSEGKRGGRVRKLTSLPCYLYTGSLEVVVCSRMPTRKGRSVYEQNKLKFCSMPASENVFWS